MPSSQAHIEMISLVATAMGPDLCREVVFVGGCTTSLLLTDSYASQQVRHTDDVDLIVHVIGKPGWYGLLEKLRTKGFREEIHSEGPYCALRLNGMRVDFMPDDPSVLGSSTNEWYKEAFQQAFEFRLGESMAIRLVRPEHFLVTKLAAYLGRGNNDPLESRDVEDILNLIDGRPELMRELLDASTELRQYASTQLSFLQKHRDFDYAVQTAANGDPDREELIMQRIKTAVSYGSLVGRVIDPR